MSQDVNAWTELTDHKLECPVCTQTLRVEVKVDITDVHVRVGVRTFNRNTLFGDSTVAPRQVRIHHECAIPQGDD